MGTVSNVLMEGIAVFPKMLVEGIVAFKAAPEADWRA
jgi:hypothetical protein